MSRSRSYVYTLNNYTSEEEEAAQLIECTYHVYGRESGDSGTPHLQGFLYFPSLKSFKQVSGILPRAHIEVTRSVEHAIQYSKKDGDFWEKGTAPIGGVGKKCTMSERAAKNKRLLEEPLMDLVASGELSANQVPIIKKARVILAQEGSAYQSESVRGVWYWGPPGVGKSHKARKDFPDAHIKAQNKWWDGYTGQAHVILDDFDKQGVCLGHYLKIWADKWACNGEIKGGTVALRHEVLVITSNYHPDDLWNEDSTMCDAIKRRFKITHFSELNKN